jgi:hypothetical protein
MGNQSNWYMFKIEEKNGYVIVQGSARRAGYRGRGDAHFGVKVDTYPHPD